MEPIEAAMDRAFVRGGQLQQSEPRAVAVRLDALRARLVVELVGDVEMAIPVRLLGFPDGTDLTGVRVEGGGFDLYFPAIDEGSYVPDLVRLAVALPRAA